MRRRIVGALASAAAAALLLVACGGGGEGGPPTLPRGAETVELDPADLSVEIDDPYRPMKPGSRWVYREYDGAAAEQRIVVTVTRRTKKVADGIEARVVREVVTEDGVPVEVTDDWYAQDEAGNVWYLGEATTEYEDGKPVGTAGSFEAGVDGAQPGIVMPARASPGLVYRQEYYAGEAEDKARIVCVAEQAEVPFGHFRGVLMTCDVNPLEPKGLEFKLYAKGIGPVLAIGVSGSSDREELVRFETGR